MIILMLRKMTSRLKMLRDDDVKEEEYDYLEDDDVEE